MEIVREDIKIIARKLDSSPAVVILGPRQVGKTTLALQLAGSRNMAFIYLDLESNRDVSKLGDDAETFLNTIMIN
jgi:uncharacterized protein